MTRNGLYVLAGALMFATSALHASRTWAQTQQQIDWCNNNGNAFSVDQRIGGCTALVESGRASVQNRAAGYGNRCLAYSDKGDPDRAITDCNDAIRLNPKLAGAYVNRGKAYSDKYDFDRAIADYDQAIGLNPKSSIAYNNRCDECYPFHSVAPVVPVGPTDDPVGPVGPVLPVLPSRISIIPFAPVGPVTPS